MDDDEDCRGLVIHLAEEEGKGHSLDEIKSSTKQTVRAPSEYNTLITQLEYFWGAYSIFFGSDSLATTAIKNIIEEVVEHKAKFKKAANRDRTFATRFLYAIDVRFQEFLHLCKLAKRRDDVDDRILDISDLIHGVRFGSFNMELPPNTTSVDEAKDIRTRRRRKKETKTKPQRRWQETHLKRLTASRTKNERRRRLEERLRGQTHQAEAFLGRAVGKNQNVHPLARERRLF